MLFFAVIPAMFVFSISAMAASTCAVPPQFQAATQNASNSKAYATLGAWFEQQKQFGCAADSFKKAAVLDPSSASLQYSVGISFYSSGQLPKAAEALNRAVALNPSSVESRLALGVVLHDIGSKSEALRQWEAALNIDPGSIIALDWIAKARIEAGQYTAAIDMLRTAPADEELTLDLVIAYSKAGMSDQAIAILEKTLVRQSGSLRLSNALATVFVQRHRYADAVTILKKSSEQHPNDHDTELLYLRVLILMGDSTTASPLASRLLAADPKNFDVLYLNGLLERESGDYDSAKQHLETAASIQPNHYDVTYNLGVALAKLHQPAAARDQLQKAIVLNHEASEAHFQLAAVLRTLGDTESAHRELEIYQRQMQAKSTREQGANLSTQAAQKLAGGDVIAAVALYREAQTVIPNDAIQFYNLSLALDRLGDTKAEEAALERAVQLRPDLAPAQNQLGYLAAQAGDAPTAERYFRKAIAAAPEYAEAENNLGTLLAGQSQDTEAEQYFRAAVTSNPRLTDAWINLAATLAGASRYSEAKQAASSALRVDPDNQDARKMLQMLASNGVGTP